ncbi:hypothetical protein ACSBR2_040024 [Camellia fascicularis]
MKHISVSFSCSFREWKVLQRPKADDFFFSGLLTPRNTSNPVGSIVTPVNVMQIPGLNTLGISLARIDLQNRDPWGLRGYPLRRFCNLQSRNRLFTKALYPGDVFVFPEGLIHFQFNQGKTNAIAISGLSSQNPGIITIANVVFGSNPKIYDDVLAKAFQVDKKVVDYLQAQFWWPNN